MNPASKIHAVYNLLLQHPDGLTYQQIGDIVFSGIQRGRRIQAVDSLMPGMELHGYRLAEHRDEAPGGKIAQTILTVCKDTMELPWLDKDGDGIRRGRVRGKVRR
jgi:hypothetical protein